MKYSKVFFIAFFFIITSLTSAKMVEYGEDGYLMQAPQEIITVAERAAIIMDFKNPYEITIPKKPGLAINPWNRFIAFGINPQTKNSFMIVNPAWFSHIPEDQQTFLMALNFSAMQHGSVSIAMKVVPFMFFIIGIFLIILFIWLLGKTVLIKQQQWVRVLIAVCLLLVLDNTIFEIIAKKINVYLASAHNTKVIVDTVHKTRNKEAAIKAYEYLDACIKKELAEGETFFTAYERIYEDHAESVKKMDLLD